MILLATHTTTYLYSAPVSICHTEVHLTPRETPTQRTLSHELKVTPAPAFSVSRDDYFGNETTCFSIHEPHETLTITSESEVEMLTPEPPVQAGPAPAWEQVRDRIAARTSDETFRASEFACRSPFVKLLPEFAAYGAISFRPRRSIAEAGFDLCHRIFTEFKYDPRATTISTPVDEVLRARVGVCQDFAHVMISCARSLGLPARYVSGYLRSGEKTMGAEASHAWCALFCPEVGWLDFDPTNDVIPHGNHVTIACGRDYSDVAPVRGVALGGGHQIVNVSVAVRPRP